MAASVRRHFILISLIGMILVILLLRQCIWKNSATEPAAPVSPLPDASAERAAEVQRILAAPPPVVVFTPPPPPPPSTTPPPEPAPAVVRPKPAPAKPKPVRRTETNIASKPVPKTSTAPATTSRPAPAPTYVPKPDIEPGAFYVVRQKVEQGGRYYVICTIMGDVSNRRFGYAISAEQYAKTDRGLVFDSRNMTGWQRVNRIE